MTPRNIEIFENVVAISLVKLYEAFPNPIDLDASDVGFEVAADSTDDEEMFQIMGRTAASSIDFLVEEGFVRYAQSMKTLSDEEVFPQAVLTLRGFTLLDKTPTAVDSTVDRRPYADQLKSVVKDGAKSAAKEVVKSLLTTAATMGAGAL